MLARARFAAPGRFVATVTRSCAGSPCPARGLLPRGRAARGVRGWWRRGGSPRATVRSRPAPHSIAWPAPPRPWNRRTSPIRSVRGRALPRGAHVHRRARRVAQGRARRAPGRDRRRRPRDVEAPLRGARLPHARRSTTTRPRTARRTWTTTGSAKRSTIPADALRTRAVVYAERDGKILLLKRGRCAPGEWFLPGGAVDPGELPEDAARRELSKRAACASRGSSR